MAVSEKIEKIQVLSFNLAEEVFAVEIKKVREVLDYKGVTSIPRMPGYMIGVINLRGNVVPVIDMKKKFGMKATERTVNTCVIILETEIGKETVVMGILADSVQEVVDFNDEEMEPAPKIGSGINTDFIQCMAKKEEEFVIVLDIDSIFLDEDLQKLKDLT